jgi:hypothetical protein
MYDDVAQPLHAPSAASRARVRSSCTVLREICKAANLALHAGYAEDTHIALAALGLSTRHMRDHTWHARNVAAIPLSMHWDGVYAARGQRPHEDRV